MPNSVSAGTLSGMAFTGRRRRYAGAGDRLGFAGLTERRRAPAGPPEKQSRGKGKTRKKPRRLPCTFHGAALASVGRRAGSCLIPAMHGLRADKTYRKWNDPNRRAATFGEASPKNHRADDAFDRKIAVTRRSERNGVRHEPATRASRRADCECGRGIAGPAAASRRARGGQLFVGCGKRRRRRPCNSLRPAARADSRAGEACRVVLRRGSRGAACPAARDRPPRQPRPRRSRRPVPRNPARAAERRGQACRSLCPDRAGAWAPGAGDPRPAGRRPGGAGVA